MPVLVKRIKESGLVVCTYGAENGMDEMVKIQERNGVNAFLYDNVFKNES